MRRMALLPMLLLGGCRCGLPEIVGGDSYLRSIVQPTVNRFYEAAPADQICVRRIDIIPANNKNGGRYYNVQRLVELHDVTFQHDPHAEWNLLNATNHELCHAAENQLGIPLDLHDWPLEVSLIPRYPERLHDNEAFAGMCQLGPEAVQLIGESCEADSPGARKYPFIRDWVYPRRLDTVRWTTAKVTPQGGSEVFPIVNREWSVRPAPPGAFRLATEQAPDITIDAWTGERIEAQPIGHEVLSAGPPSNMAEVAGVSNGTEDLMVVRAYSTVGDVATRYVLRDADGVLHRMGCAPEDAQPFSVDGELFAAWREDSVLRWAHFEVAE